MESEIQQSEKSIKQQPEELPVDAAELPPADLRIMPRPVKAGPAEYHMGYADGMREGVLIVAVAMLVSIFLMVRYMNGEA